MKLLIALSLCLLSSAFLHAEETDKKLVFDTVSYGLDHYGKLLDKSPFDFDAPPAGPAEPPPPPMEGWALAGLTKTDEHKTVVLINLKTSERIRLSHYNDPPTPRANTTKMGADLYTLEEIEFEKDEPKILKNATALITKNGEPTTVKYSEQVLALKPAPAPIVMPGAAALGGNKAGPGAAPPPRPGQPGAAANNTNANLQQLLQQRNAQQNANPGAAQPAANGAGVAPAPVPTANGTPPAAAQVNVQPSATPRGAETPTTPNSRRRVVMPTGATDAAPAPAPAPVPAPQ